MQRSHTKSRRQLLSASVALALAGSTGAVLAQAAQKAADLVLVAQVVYSLHIGKEQNRNRIKNGIRFSKYTGPNRRTIVCRQQRYYLCVYRW